MKKAVLIIIPILILLAAGGFLVLKGKLSTSTPVVVPTPTVENIPIAQLAETNPYGVAITPRFDKKAVFLKITSFPPNLKTIEYELTYETEEGPRGVLGTIDYNGEEKIFKDNIELGTCSKNVCRYDKGVKEVTLTIVFRGKKTEKFQGTFSLE